MDFFLSIMYYLVNYYLQYNTIVCCCQYQYQHTIQYPRLLQFMHPTTTVTITTLQTTAKTPTQNANANTNTNTNKIPYIDLRSDVVSQPPPQMLLSISQAQVGDDVYQDDPTANTFQSKIAQYFGFESSLILPSTTMANLVSILLLTRPGDEVIVWGGSYAVQRESAAMALIGGVQTRQILSQSGVFAIDEIKKRVRKENQHVTFPNTKVVYLENPTFLGQVWGFDKLVEIREFCEKEDIKLFIDGARILNAVGHYKCPSTQIAKTCHIMTMCMSKGLCCPFGSLIFGSKQDMKKARQIRKSIGGGMRQVGIIAAGGLYAMEKIIPQMVIDNQMAVYIGSMLCQIKGVRIECEKIQSNIVAFRVGIQEFRHGEFLGYLLENGVKIQPMNQQRQQYRIVTHRTIRTEQCNKFIKLTSQYFKKYAQSQNKPNEQSSHPQSPPQNQANLKQQQKNQ